jgi:hypothetical protein
MKESSLAEEIQYGIMAGQLQAAEMKLARMTAVQCNMAAALAIMPL